MRHEQADKAKRKHDPHVENPVVDHIRSDHAEQKHDRHQQLRRHLQNFDSKSGNHQTQRPHDKRRRHQINGNRVKKAGSFRHHERPRPQAVQPECRHQHGRRSTARHRQRQDWNDRPADTGIVSCLRRDNPLGIALAKQRPEFTPHPRRPVGQPAADILTHAGNNADHDANKGGTQDGFPVLS